MKGKSHKAVAQLHHVQDGFVSTADEVGLAFGETNLITIRDYSESDANVLWELFFYTIRNINVQDYTQAQVEAWASDKFDSDYWSKRMNSLSPFVAEIEGVIVGYTDLQSDGLIDHFFCHHEYQGKGVGGVLMRHVLELGQLRGVKRFYSKVSITARPFYEHYGFSAVREQIANMNGQKLRYVLMEKIPNNE